MKMSIHKKIAITSVTVLALSITALFCAISQNKNKVKYLSVAPQKIIHTYEACKENGKVEHSLSTKENYQLLVLCGGYTIPSDATIAIDVDQVFLKDLTKNTYYGLMTYESPVSSSYAIEIVAYPRLFIRSCWEGCSAPVMVELNQGPGQPQRYFDLRESVYRNNVNDFLAEVNGKIVVAGPQMIAEFDPKTFNITPIYSGKENENIGYSTSFPTFMSSVKKVDATHVAFSVYTLGEVLKNDGYGNEVVPDVKYTKTLEVK